MSSSSGKYPESLEKLPAKMSSLFFKNHADMTARRLTLLQAEAFDVPWVEYVHRNGLKHVYGSGNMNDGELLARLPYEMANWFSNASAKDNTVSKQSRVVSNVDKVEVRNSRKRKGTSSQIEPLTLQIQKGTESSEPSTPSKKRRSLTSTPETPTSLTSGAAEILIGTTSHVLSQTAQEPDTGLVRRKSTAKTSQFWSPVKSSVRFSRDPIPAVPFAPLDAPTYGLIQEELAEDPYKVLVAVLFLVKTRGLVAIPAIRKFLSNHPTPVQVAVCEAEDLFPDINHLGLANKRAEALIELSKTWVTRPPTKNKRFRKLHYPSRDDGKDIDPAEQPLADDDPRTAFEVCDIPHIGAYGVDSWRIFCRDQLRGVPTGLIAQPVTTEEDRHENAKAIELELQQEWTRVKPEDKELRRYICWRWMRLGWLWNPETGERTKVKKKILKRFQKGQMKEYGGFWNPYKS